MSECFKIENRPEVEVLIVNETNRKEVKVSALIDTGYRGSLLVSYDVYSYLSPVRVEIDLKYYTLNGLIEVERGVGTLIKIGKLTIQAPIEAPKYPWFEIPFNLVGRELLSRLKVSIIKGEKACLEDP